MAAIQSLESKDMLVKLEFDLSKEEDCEDWEIYKKAKEHYFANEEFREWLRYEFKHREMTDAEDALYNEIAEKFWEIMGSHGLNN